MLSFCCDFAPLTAVAPSVAGIGAEAAGIGAEAGALGSVGAENALTVVTAAGVTAAAFLACDACRPVGLPIAFSLCMCIAYAAWLADADGAGAAACEATGAETGAETTAGTGAGTTAGAGAETAAGAGAEAGARTGAGLAISMSHACFDDGRQGAAQRGGKGGLQYFPEPAFVKYRVIFDGI